MEDWEVRMCGFLCAGTRGLSGRGASFCSLLEKELIDGELLVVGLSILGYFDGWIDGWTAWTVGCHVFSLRLYGVFVGICRTLGLVFQREYWGTWVD